MHLNVIELLAMVTMLLSWLQSSTIIQGSDHILFAFGACGIECLANVWRLFTYLSRLVRLPPVRRESY